jgi:hypothetical protein
MLPGKGRGGGGGSQRPNIPFSMIRDDNPQYQRNHNVRVGGASWNMGSVGGGEEGRSGEPQWPTWAKCIVCCNGGLTNNDLMDKYGNLDFYALPCSHMICSKACIHMLKKRG